MEKIPTSVMRFSETGPEPETVGVGAACGPLGIWALTFQERLSGLHDFRVSALGCYTVFLENEN